MLVPAPSDPSTGRSTSARLGRRVPGHHRPWLVIVPISLAAVAIAGLVTGRSPHGPSPLTPAEEAIATLRRDISNERAECMTERGFPQLADAERFRPKRRSEIRGITYWNPLESGPMHPSQAREFGLLGTGLMFEESVPGEIHSTNPAFDSALDRCNDQLDSKARSDLGSRLADWEVFASTVRSSFVEHAMADTRWVLRSQLSCFGAAIGLPSPPADLDHALDELGVRPGTSSRPESRAVRLDGVEIIETSRSTYQPTPGEVRAALAYASCAEAQRFPQRLLRHQRAARRLTLRRYEHELERWETWANRTAERIGRAG